jgi:hypothetical protein
MLKEALQYFLAPWLLIASQLCEVIKDLVEVVFLRQGVKKYRIQLQAASYKP